MSRKQVVFGCVAALMVCSGQLCSPAPSNSGNSSLLAGSWLYEWDPGEHLQLNFDSNSKLVDTDVTLDFPVPGQTYITSKFPNGEEKTFSTITNGLGTADDLRTYSVSNVVISGTQVSLEVDILIRKTLNNAELLRGTYHRALSATIPSGAETIQWNSVKTDTVGTTTPTTTTTTQETWTRPK